MKNVLLWPLAAMVIFALSGCGLKGPLYFPPADKSSTQKNSQSQGVAGDGSSQQNGVSPEKLGTHSRS
jgi:predicted small lipoprotein YifL